MPARVIRPTGYGRVNTDRVFDQLPDGRDVRLLTIGSEPGPVVEVLTLGATVHRLFVRGGDGVRRNVVLGHPDVAERLASSDYIGGTIGRYANRIAGGRFELGGRTVEVRTHDRGNSLHGGPEGFDVRLWDVVSHTADEVVLSLVSPDGDQGFPGESPSGALPRRRERRDGGDVGDDRRHHGGGPDEPRVLEPRRRGRRHDRRPRARRRRRRVHAGRRDQHPDRRARAGGRDARSTSASRHPLRAVASTTTSSCAATGLRRHAAALVAATATTVEVWSDQPGLQVYTGDMLDGPRYLRRAGVALEPQVFPDSPNHPEWPSAVLEPGETYRSTIEWRFSS